MVEDLIQRLDKWLRENRPDYYKELSPGATEKEIQKLEQTLDLQLPTSFKRFLCWKNGQLGDTKFVSNWSLNSYTEIIGQWNFLNDFQVDGTFEIENWWNRNWIPFLYDFTGNSCCIDMAGMFNGNPGQILYYWHDENARTIIHQSFNKWLETIVLAMENEVIYYGQEGGEFSGYLRFSAENNPGYPIFVWAK